MDNFDNFISDEMLAAYIDGHSLPIEDNIINGYVECDEIQELFDIVSDINDNPEIFDVGENLQAESPDRLDDKIDNPFMNVNQEVEDFNKHIM